MTNPMTRILEWLRAGYPQGVDEGDYIALLGVLHRSLTDEEVEQLVIELHRGERGIRPEVTEERIRTVIHELVHEEPTKEDVQRVLEKLESTGWPRVQAGQRED